MAADSGSPVVEEALPLAAQPGPKRRKIRKGTRSCWECKRRKNKCTWASGEVKCDDCQRRGTRCIGQEFPEEQVPHERRGANKSDDDRIRRLEALVEELSRKIDPGNTHGPHTQFRPDDRSNEHSIRTSPGRRTAVAARDVAGPCLQVFSSTIPGPLHPALTAACSGYQTPPTPKDLLRLPPPGTTPVTIARKLLALGTYLQVLSSQSNGETTCSTPEFHVVSSRALDTVSKLITHNDNIPESVEMIECLVMEGQYHNYMGNVRQAWKVLRRAIAMAQLLGIDNTHTLEAQVGSHQESVWFLLVHFDQYVSLMLGTSPSLPENSQIAPGLLERYTPSEQMGRLHSMAAGRILRRNRSINMYDIIETGEIDKILQKAAACMPAQWWLPPDWSDDCSGEESITRLMCQFANYNITLQLHLPIMLHSLSSRKSCYSTTAVITSCREILTRFTTFRNRYPTVSYCRGLDFFTFVASAALCLLSIYASYESLTAGHCDSIGVSDLLAHQRISNRGLMERALQNIEKISQIETDDKIISEIIPTFRKLLAIEEEAYEGASYTIHLPSNVGLLKRKTREMANSDDALYLDLPFCGTIRVERANLSNNLSTEVLSSEQTTQMTHILMGSFPTTSEGCFATYLPGSSAPEQEHGAIAGGFHVDQHQPHIVNAYTIVPPTSDLQPIPYSSSDGAQDRTSTSKPLATEMMDDFGERLNPIIDTGFLESLLDIQ
ncbi:hypothetical protein GQX73_g1429 [Xylaria multiplex]|uniref:Zn(2)-C6 fungal-type domain-containing protein n=1 Tax=Xylaria multiplex TaxID=323545 RepID=A0A7C8ITV4_9PEZI|nr:hypothetical protein GQX73_g1429 [Xylaria multiplex]